MKNMVLTPNTVIELKKPHPCGSNFFTIVRIGSDVKIRCNGCGRDMTFDRIKVEKAIRKVYLPKENFTKEEEQNE